MIKTTVTMPAEDVRPGRLVVEPDGRMRRIHSVVSGPKTVTLIYTDGPSDTYRRSYELDVVPVPTRDPWDTMVFSTVGPLR